MDPQSPRGSDMAVVLVSGFCDLLRQVSVNEAVHRNGFGVELLGEPGNFDVVLKSNMGLLTHLHNATWRKTHKNFRGALDALNKSMKYTLSPTELHSNWTLHQAEHLTEFWRTVARKVRRPGNSSNGLINDLRRIFNVSAFDVDTDEDCEDEDTQMVPWPGSPASPVCSVVHIPDSQSVAEDDPADPALSVPTFINAVVAECVQDAEKATIDHQEHKKQRLLLKKKPAAAAQMRKRPAGAPPEEVGVDAAAGLDPVMRRPARDPGAAIVPDKPLRSCVIARMRELLRGDEGSRGEPRAAPTIHRMEQRGKTLFQIRNSDCTVGQTTVRYFGTEEHAHDVAHGVAEMWKLGYSKGSINHAKTSMRN